MLASRMGGTSRGWDFPSPRASARVPKAAFALLLLQAIVVSCAADISTFQHPHATNHTRLTLRPPPYTTLVATHTQTTSIPSRITYSGTAPFSMVQSAFSMLKVLAAVSPALTWSND